MVGAVLNIGGVKVGLDLLGLVGVLAVAHDHDGISECTVGALVVGAAIADTFELVVEPAICPAMATKTADFAVVGSHVIHGSLHAVALGLVVVVVGGDHAIAVLVLDCNERREIEVLGLAGLGLGDLGLGLGGLVLDLVASMDLEL